MNNVAEALSRAGEFVNQALTRLDGAEVQDGVPRLTAVHRVLLDATGVLDAAHLRASGDVVAEHLDNAEGLHAALEQAVGLIEEAIALNNDRHTRLELGLGEVEGDRAHAAATAARTMISACQDAAHQLSQSPAA